MKRCKECEVELVVGDNWAPSSARSRRYDCRQCAKTKQAVWRRENADKIQGYNAAWLAKNDNRARNLASQKSWRADNADYLREWAREYQRDNPRVLANNANRRARMRAALAPDRDEAAIKRLYELAVNLTEKFGVAYHVDHVFPISKGGLHHQDNMVVMIADLNRAKSDHIIPELIDFFS